MTLGVRESSTPGEQEAWLSDPKESVLPHTRKLSRRLRRSSERERGPVCRGDRIQQGQDTTERKGHHRGQDTRGDDTTEGTEHREGQDTTERKGHHRGQDTTGDRMPQRGQDTTGDRTQQRPREHCRSLTQNIFSEN